MKENENVVNLVMALLIFASVLQVVYKIKPQVDDKIKELQENDK